MLLLTFLRELKKKSKILFALFAFITVLQVLLTLLKLEVTPFLLYGMYSEKIPARNQFSDIRIYFDGTPLDSIEMNLRHKDIFYTNMKNYVDMMRNHHVDVVQSRVEDRYQILTSSSFYPWIKNRIFNTRKDMEEFEAWYKERAAIIFKRPVNRIDVYEVSFVLDRSVLKYSQNKTPNLIASF